MASLSNWFRYVSTKCGYSVSLYQKTHGRVDAKSLDTIIKTILMGKLTFLHKSKGEEVAPTIGTQGGTFLVRRIPRADATNVFVGDLVVLKDPINSDKYLVRRLAAIEGHEMASADEKDEPFVLEKNECWVLAENEDLKPKDSYDSRSFGPVTMKDIIGRAIYCLRNDVDHGPVNNSHLSTSEDSPVLAMELDVDEMKKNHKQ
ncbi:Peptidase S24/S26A/S26B/S26C family protein [Perilla frutescens var. hirtella]|uniref:Peptidase S24/S26A/S26B/S26C family protein n=1 Tax=Perilla frutescens var. hirtella TaxID=608512 RepID=A0AAD4PD46_PERFH|nr:Peptidase S24/S26A/S26B/S26C family protein [Perilla frutescens var. hirtella]KAH6815090.1 Peptidase S24/S26A/S26B/S26C family protein [Perilla frutescens var. frutescens]KAH6834507.1 Peptidase S24/S26A/S26B/S26C family protein [Perilla frutescens var. hirtella]